MWLSQKQKNLDILRTEQFFPNKKIIPSYLLKFIFGLQINIEVFYKFEIFWVCVTRHAQSTQNKKFTYFCSTSSKAWGMKLIFCLQIKRKIFNKMIISLGVRSQACRKYPSQQVCNISKKTWRMTLIFCLQINPKGFFKLILEF